MFTGIIESRGEIREYVSNADGAILKVALGSLDVDEIAIGDSIAVNGACLTVTELREGIARFDVSSETLDKCLIGGWRAGDVVNLERALTLSTPLGGHLVSGHVDGIGVLDERTDSDDSTWMRVRVPGEIGRYIAIKGSVAVDGISLTTNRVYDEGNDSFFELTLVPHTLQMTNLAFRQSGDRFHIEVDLIARYLDRMQNWDQVNSRSKAD